MTREEAIRIIKECKEKGFKYTFYTIEEYHTALDMAIQALEQEPCEDTISRELVKAEYKRRLEADLIDESRGIDWSEYADCEPFNKFIDSIPSVNPQPKTGYWIKTPHGFKCSKCLIVHSRTSIFCPSCGAKMIEPQESEVSDADND